jgi:hypothetical protein
MHTPRNLPSTKKKKESKKKKKKKKKRKKSTPTGFEPAPPKGTDF